MALFEARNVTKQFGSLYALNKVSISVPEQSIFGLLGPNGAGKTTLIRIINHITGPDSGELFLDGRKLKPEDVLSIGYLPEERGLYKKMKVGEQVLYFARLKGLSKAEAMRRLKYWFRKLDMVDWWGKKVEELSKGMQQKVQFVTTILHEPKLIILDEPFSGFDPVNTNIIKNEILFLRERGATVILSTHNMASVEELCDNIALINKAKTILEGRVDDIRMQWAGDEYEIVFEGDATLSGNGNISILDRQFENNRSTIKFKAGHEKDTNLILSEAVKRGKVISFNPALPSMNDIFIRVVETRS
ncbi:MAG TPA: ATP-binding cassette domain-containing protein [Bacteroidales bacterium]|jgi:ABC-2 type transport system ATP-binding protein|nr:ATP-binding cassette domain-containing protein [Bacteroidales bacterium]MDI9552242.1 ATP-binding cassette domain-containing protein [Bacteroidota bacterium]NLK53837.1 ATP-binding cassette domain-containing protein [Bacteroidales bacterium]HNY52349.1 ATP-binding cassette domain-containing protein [Bacteroidales bacterium]HOG56802.1 ATP-binding cassette domain-containing protein [Bacteroidales bacterium]